MRVIAAIVLLATVHRADADKPFDLATCAIDLGKPAAAPAGLGDLPHERGKPPGVLARFRFHDAGELERETTAIAAMLPAAWSPQVVLDRTGMAEAITIVLPGAHTSALLRPAIASFVRAHPCLFGIADPSRVDAHVYNDRYVIVDVQPHAFGSLSANVSDDHGKTTIAFMHHLWPIADPTVKVRADVIKRYLGREVDHWAYHYVSSGHGDGVSKTPAKASVDDFQLSPGPVLMCTKDGIEARDAILVTLATMTHAVDTAMVLELPAPLDPTTGAILGNAWIAPMLVKAADNYVEMFGYVDNHCLTP